MIRGSPDRDPPSQKWNVVIELTATIKSMYDTLPLVQDLRDEAMRERHWKKLMAIVRCPPRFDPNLWVISPAHTHTTAYQRVTLTAYRHLRSQCGPPSFDSNLRPLRFEPAPRDYKWRYKWRLLASKWYSVASGGTSIVTLCRYTLCRYTLCRYESRSAVELVAAHTGFRRGAGAGRGGSTRCSRSGSPRRRCARCRKTENGVFTAP